MMRKDLPSPQDGLGKHTDDLSVQGEREVSLPKQSEIDDLDLWLDRQTTVRANDSEAPPDSELWKRINNETEMLRRRTTPIAVQQRILSALPDIERKNARKGGPFRLAPTTAILAGIALLALGLLLGMVLLSR
jgi:hypothetical protein